MCIKHLRKSIKVIEAYNKATGTDSSYSVFELAVGVVILISGLVTGSFYLVLLAIFGVITGIYGYFQPLLIYRYPILDKLSKLNLFIVGPIASFFMGVVLCKVYFFQDISKFLMIVYATGLLVVSIGIGFLYARDAINHIINFTEKKSNVFYLLLEIYQLILLFAFVYSVIYVFDHTGFKGVNSSNAFTIYLDMFYFSTITFTTLGYGDIVPVNPFAKGAVIVEVFLFVVVISLVVVNLSSRFASKESVLENKTAEDITQENPPTE